MSTVRFICNRYNVYGMDDRTTRYNVYGMDDRTTIRISVADKKRLAAFGDAGESMNTALRRVLEIAEEHVAENATTDDDLGFA